MAAYESRARLLLVLAFLGSSPSAWAQTAIYYSVGTNAADLKSGSPTVSLSGGIATFSEPQPDFVGLGDVVTHSGSTQVFISGRTSPTVYTVQTATGGVPADVAGATVNSIRRAFNSLDAATENSSDPSHLNTSDLVAGDYQLNWVCYNDGPDPLNADIEEPWVTGPDHYIRVFTPTSANEVGTSQRHRGIAGTGYRIAPTGDAGTSHFNFILIGTVNGYVRLEGIEIDGSGVTNGENLRGIFAHDGSGTSEGVWISHCLVHDITNTTIDDSDSSTVVGIKVNDTNNSRVWNNFVYNLTNDSNHASSENHGIEADEAGKTHHVYNNTVNRIVSNGPAPVRGIYDRLGPTMHARNNYVGFVFSSGSTEACFLGTFAAVNNNVSYDATATGPGSQINKTDTASYFVSTAPGTENWHLLDESFTLWGSSGADLDGDPNLPVTDDIDGAARDTVSPDIGADEFGSPDSCNPIIHYRSIGTDTNPLANTGTASVALNDAVVTFSGVTLPSNLGKGDRIFLDTGGVNEEAFILTRDSDTQVTLQTPAQSDHGGGVPYLIERAYNAVQDWETARQGDLVLEGRREVGVAYHDGPFLPGTTTTINGSITDSCHFLWLTVAEGHGHGGKAGVGVVLDGQDADRRISVQDPYTIIDGFELKRIRGVNNAAAVTVSSATNVLLQNLLIHDFDDGGFTVSGIAAFTSTGYTVRNSIIYDGDTAAIHNNASSASGTVQNSTLHGSQNGVLVSFGAMTVTNTIAMGHTTADFSGTMTQSYNVSDDGTAACGTCLPNRDVSTSRYPGAGDWVIFESTTAGSEDFHLQDNVENDAIDAGDDLSASFPRDIDGQSRLGGSWDIGADEAETRIEVATGTYTGTGIAGFQITGLGFPPDFVIVKADFASTEGVMRSATMSASKGLITFSAFEANLVTSLDQDGFTVGDDLRVNGLNVCGAGTDPCQYYWTAFQAGSDLKLGTYVGDGAASRDIAGLGFSPEYVIILCAEAEYAYHRMASSDTNKRVRNGSGVTPETIAALGADGFTVAATGTGHEDMNQSGQNYHYVAFNEVSGKVKLGSYAGTGTDDMDVTGVGFQPEYVLIQNTGASSDGPTVHRSDKMAGDASGDLHGSALNPNRIQALIADGFRVGSFAAVNDSSENYAYVAFNAEPLPTSVSLIRLTARGLEGSVLLEWETASELDNLGFRLYRAASEQGSYAPLTSGLIPGLGSSPRGASYRYLDTSTEEGVTYFYKLEDVETTGKSALHGPVWAAPSPKAAPGDEPESETEGSSTRITFGEPSAHRIDGVQHGRTEMVLELITGGFHATVQEDGSVVLEAPGLVESEDPAGAGIPVYRSWVEALAGRNVEIVSVRAENVERFTSLRPAGAGIPELVADRGGTARASRRRIRGASDAKGLHPAEPARVVSVGFQGEVKKALVELAPLRWNPASGELLLARRLRVRLAFRGREPAERSLDGRLGRRPPRRARPELPVLTRLAVMESGLYGVRYESLFPGTKHPLPAASLRLSRQGQAAAFHIEPNATLFGPGSTLYFASEGAALNPYGREAIYELELASGGLTMTELSAAPSGESTPHYWQRLELERNLLYQAALIDAPDLWLWDALVAPAAKSYVFELNRIAPTSEPSLLELWLQGTSDFPSDPDHHVRVRVNGSLVLEELWDGKQARHLTAELGAGFLREGENHLEIENAGGTGAPYSMVMLDRFAVSYPRLLVAENESLQGRFGQSGSATVSGLAGPAFVLDVTEAGNPGWLKDVRPASSGLAFRAEAGRSYLVTSAGAVRTPELRRAPPISLRKPSNQADYVVVGPRELLDAAAPLLELRRSQGLRTRPVTIDEVFSEFGHGEPDPSALREFLSYAYHRWQAPSLRYVLLLGDATYDFKDYGATGVVNQVPPLMVRTSYLWTASDPTLAAINGEDVLPDLAIGRLPARTVSELRAMMAKILAYEAGAAPSESRAVLVADDPDDAGDFVSDAERIAGTLLSELEVDRIYLSERGTIATRDAVREAFDRGAKLLSYIGHGGIHLWASENILDLPQVASLAPQPQQPLLLTMNCLNGYFHFPYFNSLAEELLKAEGKGVLAAFSPSGLSLNDPAHVYHQAILKELLQGRHPRLGDAVLAAQHEYLRQNVFTELLAIYHLLGDPALMLR